MPTRTRICAIAVGLLLSIGSGQAETHIKIGVLNDRSGAYADLAGAGSVIAAQMAVKDFNRRPRWR